MIEGYVSIMVLVELYMDNIMVLVGLTSFRYKQRGVGNFVRKKNLMCMQIKAKCWWMRS